MARRSAAPQRQPQPPAAPAAAAPDARPAHGRASKRKSKSSKRAALLAALDRAHAGSSAADDASATTAAAAPRAATGATAAATPTAAAAGSAPAAAPPAAVTAAPPAARARAKRKRGAAAAAAATDASARTVAPGASWRRMPITEELMYAPLRAAEPAAGADGDGAIDALLAMARGTGAALDKAAAAKLRRPLQLDTASKVVTPAAARKRIVERHAADARRPGARHGPLGGPSLAAPGGHAHTIDCRWSSYEGLRGAWVAQATQLLWPRGKPPSGGNTPVERAAAARRLADCDLTGAVVRVVKASSPSLVGTVGTAVRAGRHALLCVTPADRRVVLPAAGVSVVVCVGDTAAVVRLAQVLSRA